jgi:hypothetical protein
VKTLRVKLAFQADKKNALVSAARYESELRATPSVHSTTRAGQHTAADARLFFYAEVDADALAAIVAAATAAGSEVEELPSRPDLDECLNCGNVPDKPVAVCPNCHFREIAACPSCGRDIARQDYVDVAGDLFSCPECNASVRLVYAEPLWNAAGTYSEPVVLVRPEGG